MSTETGNNKTTHSNGNGNNKKNNGKPHPGITGVKGNYMKYEVRIP